MRVCLCLLCVGVSACTQFTSSSDGTGMRAVSRGSCALCALQGNQVFEFVTSNALSRARCPSCSTCAGVCVEGGGVGDTCKYQYIY